jgi:hypothetical protein
MRLFLGLHSHNVRHFGRRFRLPSACLVEGRYWIVGTDRQQIDRRFASQEMMRDGRERQRKVVHYGEIEDPALGRAVVGTEPPEASSGRRAAGVVAFFSSRASHASAAPSHGR